MPPSVGLRLVLFLFAPAAAILIAGTGIDYLTGIAPVRRAYDQALVDAAVAVAGHVRADPAGRLLAELPPAAVAILRTDAADSVYYVVSNANGSFIAGDVDLPQPPRVAGNPALFDLEYRGQPIRLVRYRTATAAGIANVIVAETTHKRHALRIDLLSKAIAVDLAELGAILALGWIGLKVALRPLRVLSVQIGDCPAGELSPIILRSAPVEIRPLVAALNGLLTRAAESSRSQQEFLENAAHQLKTPLAGIQAQLQILLVEPAAARLRDRLERLLHAAERLGRTTHQLLALARSGDAANPHDDFTAVDLTSVVSFVAENHLDPALAAGVELAAETAPSVVTGIRWLLEELLNNLMDNAIRHTPRGGTVTARCGGEGTVFLEVTDDGSGIRAEEREHVTARFYRGTGEMRPGAGLGLAIVAAIAGLHGAHLSITAGVGGRGTTVRIDFPRSTQGSVPAGRGYTLRPPSGLRQQGGRTSTSARGVAHR